MRGMDWDASLTERTPLVFDRVGFLRGVLRVYFHPAVEAGPWHVIEFEEVAAFVGDLSRGTAVRIKHSPTHGSFGWWLPADDPHHQVRVGAWPEPQSLQVLARRVEYRFAVGDQALNWPG